jgi:hypothetical protein
VADGELRPAQDAEGEGPGVGRLDDASLRHTAGHTVRLRRWGLRVGHPDYGGAEGGARQFGFEAYSIALTQLW